MKSTDNVASELGELLIAKKYEDFLARYSSFEKGLLEKFHFEFLVEHCPFVPKSLFEVLISDIEDLNYVDDCGYSALFTLAENYKEDDAFFKFNLILNNGADPNLRCSDDWTVLHKVCVYGLQEWVGLLVEAGADISAIADNGEYETPLMMASRYGYLDVVQQLLVAGADRESKDVYGRDFVDLMPFFKRLKWNRKEKVKR